MHRFIHPATLACTILLAGCTSHHEIRYTPEKVPYDQIDLVERSVDLTLVNGEEITSRVMLIQEDTVFLAVDDRPDSSMPVPFSDIATIEHGGVGIIGGLLLGAMTTFTLFALEPEPAPIRLIHLVGPPAGTIVGAIGWSVLVPTHEYTFIREDSTNSEDRLRGTPLTVLLCDRIEDRDGDSVTLILGANRLTLPRSEIEITIVDGRYRIVAPASLVQDATRKFMP